MKRLTSFNAWLSAGAMAVVFAASPSARADDGGCNFSVATARVGANNTLLLTIVDSDAKLSGTPAVSLGGTPLTVVSSSVSGSGQSTTGAITVKLPAGVSSGAYALVVSWSHASDTTFNLALGAQGITGPMGPVGLKGTTGATGAQGPTGPIGAPGATGAIGPQGSTGATGPTGIAGSLGPTGAVGATGLIGLPGEKGATGATGPAGAVGANGATGAQGATGLVGPQGPTGATGSAGVTGAKGPTGPAGLAGPKGDTGAAGSVGPAGDKGPKGAAGATGITGPQGLAGSAGAPGATGPQGAVGNAGTLEDLSDLQAIVTTLSAQLSALQATITPRAPTDVIAVAGHGSAVIAFAPGTPNGGAVPTIYTVTASPGGLTATGTSSPITLTGLTNGVSYTFTVVATNAAGDSLASSASSAVVPNGVASAPTITSVTIGNGAATVAFTPPASTGGLPVTGYTVTSLPGGFTATGPSSPLTVTGLANGVTYSFTVLATNADGDGPSSTVSTPVVPVGAPGAPTITGVTSGDGQAAVAFSPPASNGGLAIISYTVTSIPGGLTATGTSSPITISGLTDGVNYTFTVTANNLAGSSLGSNPSTTITPTGAPGAPTITSVTPGDGQAAVTFTPPASNGGLAITSFTVTSSPGGLTASGPTSPIIFTGLSDGQSYTFTISATNAAGASVASIASAPVTPVGVTVPGAPGAPAISDVTPSKSASADTETIYVTNDISSSFSSPWVEKFSSTGQDLGVFESNTLRPRGQAVDSAGNVYILQITGAFCRIEKFSPAGVDLGTAVNLPDQHPNSLAIDAAGNFYIVDWGILPNPLLKFSPTGGALGSFNVDNGSLAVIFNIDSAGNIYVIVNGGNTGFQPVEKYSPSGVLLETFATAFPGGAAVDAAGNIYAIGNGNGTIEKFSPMGVDLGRFASTSGTVGAFDPAGNLFVINGDNNTLEKFSPTGADLGIFATTGSHQSYHISIAPQPPPSATVSFTVPASSGASPISSYTVTSSPGGLTATGSGSPLTVTGLTKGQSYTFTVTATNSYGTSPPSPFSASVTPTGVPAAPTITGVNPGNTQATVTFTPPANYGLPITNYTVIASPGGITATGNSSPITVTGLTGGVSYTFAIVATNADGAGLLSQPSSPGTTVLSPPTAPSIAAVALGAGQAIITITPPANAGGAPITAYTVTATPGGLMAIGTGTSVTVTGLVAGQNYTFTATATNVEGTSAPSAAAGVPSAPTIIGASGGFYAATVAFNLPANNGGFPITGYTVTSSPGGIKATGPSNPITVGGLTPNQVYTFTVTASNAKGASPASAASAGVVVTGVPSAPIIGTATAADGQAIVSFQPPSSNGGAAITSYTVTAFPGGNRAIGVTSPITVTGLINGASYTFTVLAVNAGGASPASSASNSVIPIGAPTAPSIAGMTTAPGQATVSFTPPTNSGGLPITSYTVVASPGGNTATGAAGPLTVTGLTNGVSYTFTVTATNAQGTSLSSVPSAPLKVGAPQTVILQMFSDGSLIDAMTGDLVEQDGSEADPLTLNPVAPPPAIPATQALFALSYDPASSVGFSGPLLLTLDPLSGLYTTFVGYTVDVTSGGLSDAYGDIVGVYDLSQLYYLTTAGTVVAVLDPTVQLDPLTLLPITTLPYTVVPTSPDYSPVLGAPALSNL